MAEDIVHRPNTDAGNKKGELKRPTRDDAGSRFTSQAANQLVHLRLHQPAIGCFATALWYIEKTRHNAAYDTLGIDCIIVPTHLGSQTSG